MWMLCDRSSVTRTNCGRITRMTMTPDHPSSQETGRNTVSVTGSPDELWSSTSPVLPGWYEYRDPAIGPCLCQIAHRSDGHLIGCFPDGTHYFLDTLRGEWKRSRSLHGTQLHEDMMRLGIEQIRDFAQGHHPDQDSHFWLHALTIDIPDLCDTLLSQLAR